MTRQQSARTALDERSDIGAEGEHRAHTTAMVAAWGTGDRQGTSATRRAATPLARRQVPPQLPKQHNIIQIL